MYSYSLVGYLKPGQQERWRQGAGIVALRGLKYWESSWGKVQVCIVNGRKGMLGFPKGGQKDAEAPLENAFREWEEETSLPRSTLRVCGNEVLVEAGYGCHYFVAESISEDATDHEVSWKPIEDPTDPDPILVAQWMAVEKALQHPDLSKPRKDLLYKALGVAKRVHFEGKAAPMSAANEVHASAVIASPVRQRFDPWAASPWAVQG
jgi:8-oxo-dGTP pyrophosphatase MutT (NUDIX family)